MKKKTIVNVVIILAVTGAVIWGLSVVKKQKDKTA